MPVPIKDLNWGKPSGIAGFIRFVDEPDGGIRGALFLASGAGKPLEFCFTHTAGHHPITQEQDSNANATAVRYLAEALFREARRTPSAVFGLADELPPEVFTTNIRAEIPLCRLSLAGISRQTGAGNHKPNESLNFIWTNRPPTPGSEAQGLFESLVNRRDTLELFDRIADGLTETFDELGPIVAGVTSLTATIELEHIPETHYREAPPANTVQPAEHSTSRAKSYPRASRPNGPRTIRETRVPSLAERLRDLLTPPPDPSPPKVFPPEPPSPAWQDTSLEWPDDLMPFQNDGVRTLIGSERLLLADDMGLGKTVQVIAALRMLFTQRAIESALVIAPAGVLDQWRQELRKWAPELTAIIIRGNAADRGWQWNAVVQVTLVSYDTLRSDANGPQSPPYRKTWDVLVADEAQRIKNRHATSNAVKGIKRHRSWALTGTPLENNEDELASIMEFVDQGELETDKRYFPGTALRERHQELQLRRKKADVLQDLPPKRVTKMPIDLDAKQRKSYDKAEQDGIVYLKALGREAQVQHVLELITRLKQICNADPATGYSSKLEHIRERLELLAAQGHKALVFSQYTNNVSGVGAAASYLAEFNPLIITGNVPQSERGAVINRFKTNEAHKALIVSLRAGGLGLNLQEASYVFHLDRWWNPAVERQAEDRSHRYGQTVPVHVFKYSCNGTIEERIDRILEQKQELFDELVDDVSINLEATLSADQLFGLFGLERPGR